VDLDWDLDLQPMDLDLDMDLTISESEDLDLDLEEEDSDLDLDLLPWDLTTSLLLRVFKVLAHFLLHMQLKCCSKFTNKSNLAISTMTDELTNDDDDVNADK